VIVTVTPNPAYDVTYECPPLVPGEVHRVRTVHRRPGGKGVNVASVLHSLGERVTATGLATTGFATEVERCGVTAEFVPALPRVRSTLAVVDSTCTTSLWEPGVAPDDPAGAEQALTEVVAGLLTGCRCLVVSGSLPSGVSHELPARLALLARRHDVPCVVDTSGNALRLAADVPGVVLMPNADELAELAGPVTSPTDVVAASQRLVQGGADAVFATRGRDGIVVTTHDGSWVVPAVPGLTGNPTGAGDAAVAAVARGLAVGLHPVATAVDAVALAATAVMEPVAGAVDPDEFRRLRAGVARRSLNPEQVS
jgi:tagatose 6-phosphate kinase